MESLKNRYAYISRVYFGRSLSSPCVHRCVLIWLPLIQKDGQAQTLPIQHITCYKSFSSIMSCTYYLETIAVQSRAGLVKNFGISVFQDACSYGQPHAPVIFVLFCRLSMIEKIQPFYWQYFWAISLSLVVSFNLVIFSSFVIVFPIFVGK